MRKLNHEVIEMLRMPIWMVWSGIAPDALDFVKSDEEAMEMVLDAGRLEMYGESEANELVRELFKEHGFSKVCSFLSKEMRLYHNS